MEEPRKRKFGEIEDEGGDVEQPALKKAKTDAQDNLDTYSQIELPPEIMLDILKLLPADQLPPVSLVCRYWWICSKDESLAWIPFFPSVINITETKSDAYNWFYSYKDFENCHTVGDARVVKFGEAARNAIPVDFELGQSKYSWEKKSPFLLLDQNKQKIGLGAGPLIVLPDLKQPCYRYNLEYNAVHSQTNEVKLRIECNTRQIEQQVRESKFPVDDSHWMVKQCINTLADMFGGQKFIKESSYFSESPVDLISEYLDQIYNPDDAYQPPALPLVTKAHLSEIKTKLHNYQLEAVNWMTFIERDREKKYDVSPLIKVPQTELWLKFEPEKHKVTVVPHEKFDDHNLYFHPKGGILADDMGLGKTLEVIALILANPAPAELPTTQPQFPVRSTLVICPTHLVQQWAKEFDKHLTKKLNIIQVSTLVDLKKITYQQIIDADIVIVSQTIMHNRRYTLWPDQAGPALKGELSENPFARKNRVAKVLDGIKGKDLSKTKSPILDHFHWHRIVVDEAHQIVDHEEEKPFQVISLMSSTYNWYISGTPFPTALSFENIRRFLGLQPKLAKSCNLVHTYFKHHPAEVYLTSIIDEMIVQELMWRNTKESIAQEYKMVSMSEDLILMDESPVESLDYDQIGKSLTDVKQNSITSYNEAIKTAQDKIAEWQEQIKRAEELLSNPPKDAAEGSYSYSRWRAEHNLNTLPESIKLKQKSIEGLTLKLDRVKATVPDGKILEVHKYGTRGGQVLIYLKKLFKNDKTARVIIFGEDSDHLRSLSTVLKENKITVALALGQVKLKVQAINEFTEKDFHVIMMNISEMSAGTNLVEASHVIFLDQLKSTEKEIVEATEDQAIGRARRQGQSRDITVVRFLMKNSPGYLRYLRMRAKPALHKSTSKLTRSGSMGALTLSQSRE